MTPTTLHIEGMSCSHCLNAVNSALAKLPGVEIREVRIGRADLSFDETRTSADAIVHAIDDAGYRATAVPA